MIAGQPAIFFDFDSTVVTREGLEEMISDVLKMHEDAEKLMEEVKHITNLGMEGELDFKESVRRRLDLAPIKKKNFEEMGTMCLKSLTPGIENLFHWLKEKDCQIYIVSGGFEEFIFPTARFLGVPEVNCLANACVYNDNGVCVDADESNPAWSGEGKHPVIEHITMRDGLTGRKIMVGDGASDLAAYTHGAADDFIAFTANARRPSVVGKAPYVADSSPDLRAILETLFIELEEKP